MTPVAGADGCRGGWVVVRQSAPHAQPRWQTVRTFAEVLALADDCLFLAVDIPIGLPEVGTPGGRACDAAARALLGGRRGASVFSPPGRVAFGIDSYQEALRRHREASPEGLGFSVQAFGILPKIMEVDALMTPALQARVVEVHPELCFRAMKGADLAAGKRHRAGLEERGVLLRSCGFAPVPGPARDRSPTPAPDDILDAAAACWTARRLARGEAGRVPQDPPLDPRGLRMEIWC